MRERDRERDRERERGSFLQNDKMTENEIERGEGHHFCRVTGD